MKNRKKNQILGEELGRNDIPYEIFVQDYALKLSSEPYNPIEVATNKAIKASLSFLKKKLFLSKAERDYLLDSDQASHDYVCVKSEY